MGRDTPPTLRCLPSSARSEHCLCGYNSNSSCICAFVRLTSVGVCACTARTRRLFLGLRGETLNIVWAIYVELFFRVCLQDQYIFHKESRLWRVMRRFLKTPSVAFSSKAKKALTACITVTITVTMRFSLISILTYK